MIADPGGPGESNVGTPERVGRYEVLIPVGTGGMAVVYLGRTEVVAGVTRNVAIKLLHRHLIDSQENSQGHPESRESRESRESLKEELLREARLAAGIQHPNVVSVVDAGDSPYGVFLVMDYVEGDTLSALIRSAGQQQPMPIPVVARILHDALSGLHAVHEARDPSGQPLDVVHRDFTPHNIMIGLDGISRLGDFGVAKAAQQGTVTNTGIIKGKVAYMAPEQARGHRIDRRADIWAAAVVAWEALTGHRLFRADNDAATLFQIVSGEPAPATVGSERPEVAAEVDAVIAAALSPDPELRPVTALELRDRFEAAWREHGGMASHETVAKYVRGVFGEKLTQRRARVSAVLQERASGSTRTLKVRGRDPMQGGPWQSPRPRPRQRWLAAAALLAVVGGGLGWAMLRAGRGAGSRPITTETVNVVPDQQPGQQQPEPKPLAQLAGTPDPVIHVSANTPIAQLQIGERSLVLAEPARQIDVRLTLTEWSADLQITAIGVDGRRNGLRVPSKSSEVAFAFEDAPSQKKQRARPTRKPKAPLPKPSPGESLAASPYGN